MLQFTTPRQSEFTGQQIRVNERYISRPSKIKYLYGLNQEADACAEGRSHGLGMPLASYADNPAPTCRNVTSGRCATTIPASNSSIDKVCSNLNEERNERHASSAGYALQERERRGRGWAVLDHIGGEGGGIASHDAFAT